MMNQYKKWIIRFTIGAILLVILHITLMALMVRGTKNYRGAESYVSYSPDGKYRLDRIYPIQGGTYNIISSLPDNKVLIIDAIPPSWEYSITELWFCNETRTNCTGYTYGIDDPSCTINLPPSWWEQLQAWLIVKTKHLENPNFKIMRVDDNRALWGYPNGKPVTNPSPNQ